MNDQLLAAVVDELAPELRGRAFGKVWQLGRAALAVDFRLSDGRYLFASVEPHAPRLHLITRRVRDLERESLPPSGFALALRKHVGGASLRAVTKDAGERVVRFSFEASDAAGRALVWTLVAQLTGRSANLLLVDGEGRVADTLRPPRGDGQQIGESYRTPPHSPGERAANEAATVERGTFRSLNAAVEEFYRRLESERSFRERVGAQLARVRREIERRRKLERNLEADMRAHGDAGEHRRAGDLLLANVSTAEREGGRVRLTDYFAEGAPTVELEIDEHATLPEEAARRFASYARAKRAAQEIERRGAELRAELSALEAERAELERIAAEQDEAALGAFEQSRPKSRTVQQARGERGARPRKSLKDSAATFAGARRYRSSDGYEILVGRASKDNDQLTFKVARSHDLWLHAADYPGSHVVVRARGRDDAIPHRTVIEAAQLAAQFSQAKRDAKVAVNYTPRKFVSKPKGAAPGLVRLSSFRTLLVEPGEPVERI